VIELMIYQDFHIPQQNLSKFI